MASLTLRQNGDRGRPQYGLPCTILQAAVLAIALLTLLSIRRRSSATGSTVSNENSRLRILFSEEDYIVESSSSGGGGAGGNSSSSSSGGGGADGNGKGSGMLEVLRNCWDFECLRHAHAQPRSKGTGSFNFPHFLLLGWPKTATTSLFWHFVEHPDIVQPSIKEPEFFTKGCSNSPSECGQGQQGHYMRDILIMKEAVASNLTKATFEGSTHYAAAGPQLARSLAATLPWVRLLISLREPISRHLSNMAHNINRGRVHSNCKSEPYDCLLKYSYIGRNYSYPLSHWLAAFPAEQFFIMQYERLVAPESQAGILQQLDEFLGLQPLPVAAAAAGAAGATSSRSLSASGDSGAAPPALGVYNQKKDHINRKGWPMKRKHYEDLVERVRPDAQEVARLLESHGLVDSGSSWLAAWEATWQQTLETCDKRGKCMVQLT